MRGEMEAVMSRRRSLGVLLSVVGLLAAALFAAAAKADAPQKVTYSFTYGAVMTGYCPFDVAVTTDASGWRIDFVDGGTVTRSYIHQEAVDTFTTNGKTLTSLPFETNVQASYDEAGNPTFIASGIIERIPLPDGSVFVSAGKAFFSENAQVGHQLSPDRGSPGDVAAFCAALSG
jgi:PKD repeat protein